MEGYTLRPLASGINLWGSERLQGKQNQTLNHGSSYQLKWMEWNYGGTTQIILSLVDYFSIIFTMKNRHASRYLHHPN